ncbi:MAG: hypothetical protein OET44_05860 [Gammaproteobacteria bacterium]|nr:hypothetical protein [Gammaproteobacteria bacterium]
MISHRRTGLTAALLGLVLLCSASVSARAEVIVKGLTEGSAILSIDGELSVLREGESSGDVTLIRANNRGATLEINGRQRTLGLDRSIAKTYREPESDRIKRAGSAYLYRQQGKLVAGASSLLSVKIVGEQRASVALGVEYVYAGDYGDDVFLSVATLDDGQQTGNAAMSPVKLLKGKHYVELEVASADDAPVVYSSDALELTVHWSSDGQKQGDIVKRVLPFSKYWKKVRVR